MFRRVPEGSGFVAPGSVYFAATNCCPVAGSDQKAGYLEPCGCVFGGGHCVKLCADLDNPDAHNNDWADILLLTPSRHYYKKFQEFNILPDIVWDALNRQGSTISEIGKSPSGGLPEQKDEADSSIWHSKKEIDEYVEQHTKLNMTDYKSGKNRNELYKAVATEISILRDEGYIQDWGKRESRHGVWKLNAKKLERYTVNDAKREIKDGNFHASLAKSTTYVRIKQAEFRRILVSQYKKCLFCGFSLEKYVVAAHIVPYNIMRRTHPEEAMSPVDGLLLCRLCDTAFEHGSVMLEPDYEITVASELEKAESQSVKSWVGNIERRLEIGDVQYVPSKKYIKEKNNLIRDR